METIVPHKCSKCGREFFLLQGGICSSCEKEFCTAHLRRVKINGEDVFLCDDCRTQPQPALQAFKQSAEIIKNLSICCNLSSTGGTRKKTLLPYYILLVNAYNP